jgi:hypothetical protein
MTDKEKIREFCEKMYNLGLSLQNLPEAEKDEIYNNIRGAMAGYQEVIFFIDSLPKEEKKYGKVAGMQI